MKRDASDAAIRSSENRKESEAEDLEERAKRTHKSASDKFNARNPKGRDMGDL